MDNKRNNCSLTPPARLLSLDAFRGFIMFWIVGGSSLALGIQAAGHNRFVDAFVYQLNHSSWEGLRFYDCIWPCFMLMVGVSVPLAYAKHSLTMTHQQMFRRALRRFSILFLLGSIRESVSLGSPRFVELSSALQPIAIAYLVAFLLVRKSWRFQAVVAVLILLGYALLLAFVPAAGIGAGSYQKNANLVYAVDLIFLRHRANEPVFLEGWGTILSTIPTISTTLFGLLLGQLLRCGLAAKSKMRIIAVTSLAGMALGYAASLGGPVVMKMWTTSYGLLSASWAGLMFSLFYWVIDVQGYRKWAFPFVVIGMNALAVYLCETVTRLSQIVGVFTAEPARNMGVYGPLFSAVAFLVVEWSILYWMYRRKLFLSA